MKKFKYFVGYVYQPEWSNKQLFGNCHIYFEQKLEGVNQFVYESIQKAIQYYGNTLTVLSCSFICSEEKD